jgi:hypothetical protein
MSDSGVFADGRRDQLDAIDALIRDLQRRLRLALYFRSLIERDEQIPDPMPLLDVPKARRSSRPAWVLKPGTDADQVATLLESAPERGLTESEIAAELQRNGRLTSVKDPIRSVHWTLYNLERRSKAIRRGPDGRWFVIGNFPRK